MAKNKNNKRTDVLRNIVIVILVCVIAFCGFKIGSFLLDNHKEEETSKKIEKVVENNVVEPDEAFSKAAWDKLYAENNDLFAYLHFDDNSINQPIVRAKTNDEYLRHGFDKQWLSRGTVFLDASNKPDDTNLIFYGHSVDYGSGMFTPLTDYETQAGYDRCQTFTIYYKDVKKTYSIISSVYLTTDRQANHEFFRTNFNNEGEFNDWYDYQMKNNLIKSKDTAKYGDKFVTLQTCKRYTGGRIKILVTAKETSESTYN